ncbi:MAG TPA: ATP-dependent DNA ligase [Actinomycetota bacterium]|nr:ATP-dependent DNA ligase [Actinomycetota bacterium]
MPRRVIAGNLPAPMLAKAEPAFPEGEGWTFEPKWDGFRAIVAADGEGGVRIVSRDGRPLDRYFPEVVNAVAGHASARFVADGEIVRIVDGRMAFEDLQLRLHPAESRVRKLAGEIPASLILFDLLQDEGTSLLERPLAERRERLSALGKRLGLPVSPDRLDRVPPGPSLALAPWTDDAATARRWFDDETGLGEDGIVAKRADQPYQPGERGWIKVKHRRSADCVVGGYRVAKNDDGVGSLLLGLYDGDVLHYVGHTSSFSAAERRRIRAELAPLEGGVSFPLDRGPGGPSRWSGGRDTDWVSLEPTLVVEVSFDRLQGGRFRHAATFVRWRTDRDPRSCTFGQLRGEG